MVLYEIMMAMMVMVMAMIVMAMTIMMVMVMVMLMVMVMMGFLGRWLSGGLDRVIAAYKQLAHLTTSN